MVALKVSHSRVKKWRNCKKSHYYRYIEKLRPKKKARPLMFGTIVHEMVEANINGQDPWKILKSYEKKQGKLFKEEVEEYGNIVQDIFDIMTAYFQAHKRDGMGYIKINGVKAEHDFEVEIADDIVLIGKIDALARRRKDKTLWLRETKSFKNLPGDDERWKSVQIFLYDFAIKELGWGEIDGACFDYIRSKAPTRPQLTEKTGEIARVNSLVTLPHIFDEFLKENDFDLKSYKEERQRMVDRLDDQFKRIFVPIKESVAEMVLDDFIVTAQEIGERQEFDHARHIGRHCSWCEYKHLCEAELNDSDVDFVKEREYETSSKEKDAEEKETTGD